MKKDKSIFYDMGFELDNTTRLRIELNRDLISRDDFFKLQRIVKVIPEYLKIAKKISR
jgi:hypothetical protein